MLKRFSSFTRLQIFSALVVGVVWVTLVMRLHIGARLALAAGDEVWVGIVGSFGYFTVLTTLFMAVVLTVTACPTRLARMDFFMRPSVISAATTSVVLVALVYVLVLRQLWHPQGLRYWVDISLHYVIPLLFFIFWWLAVPASSLHWRQILWWLLYPLVYLMVILVRGCVNDFYPYPFVNVTDLGVLRVLINVAALLVLFAFLGLTLIAINRCRKN